MLRMGRSSFTGVTSSDVLTYALVSPRWTYSFGSLAPCGCRYRLSQTLFNQCYTFYVAILKWQRRLGTYHACE